MEEKKENTNTEMEKIYKVIVLPDIQYPYVAKDAMGAVEKYMADEKFDEYLQVGDFMDFDQLSRWSSEIPERVVNSIADDYEGANKLLDRHQSLIRKNNKNAKFTILAGNHDIRAEKFAEKFPQIKGMIEMEHALKFKERGINYIKCYPKGEIYTIGHANFHHGLYTGGNHAKKHADNFGVNIFYGHVHDVQSNAKIMFGKNKTIIGQSLGCLCKYDLDYVGKNPTNWQHAVTTFYIRPDGNFNYYISMIFNGQFTAPNGKTYKT